jgi:hypothetical protein
MVRLEAARPPTFPVDKDKLTSKYAKDLAKYLKGGDVPGSLQVKKWLDAFAICRKENRDSLRAADTALRTRSMDRSQRLSHAAISPGTMRKSGWGRGRRVLAEPGVSRGVAHGEFRDQVAPLVLAIGRA